MIIIKRRKAFLSSGGSIVVANISTTGTQGTPKNIAPVVTLGEWSTTQIVSDSTGAATVVGTSINIPATVSGGNYTITYTVTGPMGVSNVGTISIAIAALVPVGTQLTIAPAGSFSYTATGGGGSGNPIGITSSLSSSKTLTFQGTGPPDKAGNTNTFTVYINQGLTSYNAGTSWRLDSVATASTGPYVGTVTSATLTRLS